MGVTKFEELNTAQSRIYIASELPTAPSTYYGSATNDVDSIAWKGGELAYNTTINKLFIQTATSGTTATWYRYQDMFHSTTTSTSTSTSTTSSSTSTSSTTTA